MEVKQVVHQLLVQLRSEEFHDVLRHFVFLFYVPVRYVFGVTCRRKSLTHITRRQHVRFQQDHSHSFFLEQGKRF